MATDTKMKALIRHKNGYCEQREISYPPPHVLKYAEPAPIHCIKPGELSPCETARCKIKQYYLHKIERDPNTYWYIAIYTENNTANSMYQEEMNKYYLHNMKNLYDSYLFGKSTSTCTNDGSESLLSISKPTEKNMYNRLTNIAKRLLNKEVKTLVEAGFMNPDLSMTEAGRQELTSILFEKYQKELVEAAATKLEEEKETK